MIIKILDSAKKDLEAGYEFYEAQELGIGDYFLNSLYSDIDSLIIYNGIHPIRANGYYCLLSRVFPFAIYYKIEKSIIYIHAVLDCRSNPEKLENNLK